MVKENPLSEPGAVLHAQLVASKLSDYANCSLSLEIETDGFVWRIDNRNPDYPRGIYGPIYLDSLDHIDDHEELRDIMNTGDCDCCGGVDLLHSSPENTHEFELVCGGCVEDLETDPTYVYEGI